MIYNPAKTIDSVFNNIQDFQDICVLLQNSKSNTQSITYTYLVFQKTGVFVTILKDWYVKIPALKTFAGSKVFMRRQYLNLKTVSGLMVQNSSLNMMQELKNSQEELLNTLKAEVQNGFRETLQWVRYGNPYMQIPDQIRMNHWCNIKYLELHKQMILRWCLNCCSRCKLCNNILAAWI